jgi:hypothetical protein
MRLQAFLKQLAAEKNAETGEQPEWDWKFGSVPKENSNR